MPYFLVGHAGSTYEHIVTEHIRPVELTKHITVIVVNMERCIGSRETFIDMFLCREIFVDITFGLRLILQETVFAACHGKCCCQKANWKYINFFHVIYLFRSFVMIRSLCWNQCSKCGPADKHPSQHRARCHLKRFQDRIHGILWRWADSLPSRRSGGCQRRSAW